MRDAARHPAIEAFLSEIDARLHALPEARRADERAELAQHLDLLVDAYRARGLAGDEAAHAAVRRFGRAERVGAALATTGRSDRLKDQWLVFLVFWAVNPAMKAWISWRVGDPVFEPWGLAVTAVTGIAMAYILFHRDDAETTEAR